MEENEIWKIITFVNGWDHLEISNLGNLRRKSDGYLYSNKPNPRGYIHNSLINRNTGKPKTWRRHALVYFQFHPEADYNDNYGETTKGSLVINHIDEIKTNNRLDNLELITNEENVQYSCNVPVVSININDLSDIKYYVSASEAERDDPKNNNSHIIECCLKKKLSCNDRYWIYQSDDLEVFLEEVKSGKIVVGRGMYHATEIIGKNVKTGELLYFVSQREAGRNGFSVSAINRVLKRQRNTHKNYTWYYLEDFQRDNPNFKLEDCVNYPPAQKES